MRRLLPVVDLARFRQVALPVFTGTLFRTSRWAMRERRERRAGMMQKMKSTAARAARGMMQRGGRAVHDAQQARRRRLVTANIRAALIKDHKRWCSDFTPPAAAIDAARQFLSESFGGYDDIRCHELYWRITDTLDPAFIPWDVFYRKIEPTLNAMSYVPVLTDKNVHYTLPVAPYLPEPVLHIIRGDLYLPGFTRISDSELDRVFGASRAEFIVKPSVEHGGGRDLRVMDGAGAASFIKAMLSDRRSRSDADWVIQRPLDQCTEMARFNPSSVNTYRIMMMRTGQEIVCLSSVLRTGRSGMRIDNQAAGGLAGGIDDGRLRGRAMDHELRFYEVHPDSGVPFVGELPAYHTAVELCRNLHRMLPWFDLVSWDVAIDLRYDPRVIEFNTASQEINFHQMNNGPLFGPEGGAVMSALLRRLAIMPLDPNFATA